jgi:hypothetical protein
VHGKANIALRRYGRTPQLDQLLLVEFNSRIEGCLRCLSHRHSSFQKYCQQPIRQTATEPFSGGATLENLAV